MDGRPVTGASRGIGRAVALALADAGADVVVAARKEADLAPSPTRCAPRDVARSPCRPTSDGGRTSSAFSRPRSRPSAARHPGEQRRHEPGFRPSAGRPGGRVGPDHVPQREGLSARRAAGGPGHGAHGQGAIVNVASTAGLRASPGLGAYSVSKAAVIMLTRVLARELAGLGIRVNCVAPALIETRFSEALWKNPENLSWYLKSTPLGRTGRRKRSRAPSSTSARARRATSPGRLSWWTAATSRKESRGPTRAPAEAARPRGHAPGRPSARRSGHPTAARRMVPPWPNQVTSYRRAASVCHPRPTTLPSSATVRLAGKVRDAGRVGGERRSIAPRRSTPAPPPRRPGVRPGPPRSSAAARRPRSRPSPGRGGRRARPAPGRPACPRR